MPRKLVLIVAAIVVLRVGAASAEEWYEGGTLHKATGKEWHAATYRNRLATSADFLAAAKAAADMVELRARAAGLERCITEGTDSPKLQKLQVPDVAVACIVLLEYD